MPTTQKCLFVYPPEGDTSSYSTLSNLFAAFDQFTYGSYRNHGLIPIQDGGFTYSSGAATVSWTEAKWFNPFSGQVLTLAAGSIAVEDGQCLYFKVYDTSIVLYAGSAIPVESTIYVLGVRWGNAFFILPGRLAVSSLPAP